MAKDKLLKITKSDKTVHVIPMENKAFWLGYNQRMPEAQKVKIEEITEKEAEGLDYIDENYVTGIAAVEKLADKDKEIAELRKMLAEREANDKHKTADEVIALIKEATTVEAVKDLAKGDERKTVQDAADKKIEALKTS